MLKLNNEVLNSEVSVLFGHLQAAGKVRPDLCAGYVVQVLNEFLPLEFLKLVSVELLDLDSHGQSVRRFIGYCSMELEDEGMEIGSQLEFRITIRR
ncbi:hypothetical protein DK254_28905 [Pseudomonas sp. RW407]|uniref:hypothetical protein n=1 Tax=Pseudomonas sp. RW407 TaxID=2202894 RepID=UPI000D700A46|nr:hypothetical protein [Pseudomonas sp. RW407]PWU26579.1 hypothetical protein DK254_28905 [Pseudomonas sp. RW407]